MYDAVLAGGCAIADDADLIAAIYDAIIDPSRWDEVVKRIAEATKSMSGVLLVQDTDAVQLSTTHNVDPYYAKGYVEFWHQHNPLRALVASTAPGEVQTYTRTTQSDAFRKSAFFNEFVCPQVWGDSLGIGLLHGPCSSGHLILHRSPEAVWVEPQEWQLLKTLAPHLQRAAAIHSLLARARATANALAMATGFAVFLLSATCRVLFANAKAEELVRAQKGFRYERGRLAAVNPALSQRLQALARAGSKPKLGEGELGGTFEIDRGKNGPPLLAHVIPLAASRAAAAFDIDRPAAAVFVVDPAAGFRAQIGRFAARFGLTPAETRVLGEIIGGNGLLAAATKLKITNKTARCHASRIFAKTGTTRQTELIRRFFESTLPGVPGA